MVQPAILIAGASRPYPGETANGDSWRVDWAAGVCRIAVIDALGHGPLAEAEAERAISALAENPGLTPGGAINACDRALYGGRGAAITVILIDPAAGSLVHAGIGNVELTIWNSQKESRLPAQRGIVGTAKRRVEETTVELQSGWLVILHTDGVSGRYRVGELMGQTRPDPQTLAQTMLDKWSRITDDATVVIASPTHDVDRR